MTSSSSPNLIQIRSGSPALVSLGLASPALVFGAILGIALAPALSHPAYGQVITINKSGAASSDAPIDRRYAQIEPTKVDLPQSQIDARGHQDILRTLVAEQGFAMRPLPRGKRGLILAANGKLTPAGEGYLNEVTVFGLSVKPGDRVVLSNVKIDKEKIVFDINGGPEHKHEFMRHVQVGVGGPNMSAPVVQDTDQEPVGARISLTFPKFVPDVTPAQIKALLAPLISFDVKTPVQAYTDTLPPKLKEAILSHNVMVGMSVDMVLFALGPPEAKSREMDGQTPFEEWIYGHPPQDVRFVRINGNRVIRVELAKLGQPLEVFTKDEVEGLMTTDGHPVLAQASQHQTRTVPLGDSRPNPDTQAPAAPPTLRAPGEKFPDDQRSNTPVGDPTVSREGAMKPVLFPKDTTKDPARTVPAHPAPAPPDSSESDAKAAKDKTAADKTASDKAAADKTASDKAAADKAKSSAPADRDKAADKDKAGDKDKPQASPESKPAPQTPSEAQPSAPAQTPPSSNFASGRPEPTER